MKKFEIPNYPIGKGDLIKIVMVATETDLKTLDIIADLIFENKIQITSTLKRGLHKLNFYKTTDDKIGFKKYFTKVCQTWHGQAFGVNMWGNHE